ncbi:MAG: helix-turn-helix domain-containing protein [Oscillospiraceae bacterium]
MCKSCSNNIYSLFKSLQEIKSSDDFSDTIINCCINHLGLKAKLFIVNNSASLKGLKVGRNSLRIINFIDNNTRSIKKLNELSNYLGYNYSYISALFTRQTGQNIKEYFDEKRISLACELLSHGYSITDTAYELNFESVQSFNRAFKRIMGVSPGNFNHKTSRD